MTAFWPVFKPFFDISPEYFAIVQKAPILHFCEPSINVSLGKIYHPVNRLRSFPSSGHLVIRSIGHPVICSSRHLVNLSTCHLVIQTSGHLVIWSFGNPIIQSLCHPGQPDLCFNITMDLHTTLGLTGLLRRLIQH